MGSRRVKSFSLQIPYELGVLVTHPPAEVNIQFEKQAFWGAAEAVEGADGDEFFGGFAAGSGAAQKVLEACEWLLAAHVEDSLGEVEGEVFDGTEADAEPAG